MACFSVPVAEAIVTTAVAAVIRAKEKKEKAAPSPEKEIPTGAKIPFSAKLGWLNRLLWGGSALLAFEHLWHGEIVPWFPFLTAMSSPEDAADMIREISTVGVGMALTVTLVWLGMLLVSSLIEKRKDPAALPEGERK